MALPKRKSIEPTRDASDVSPRVAPVLGPVERLEAIFDDLLEGASSDPIESGWEDFKRALDAERPAGMKLFSKT